MRLRARKSSPPSSSAKPVELPPVPNGQRGRQFGTSSPHVEALLTEGELEQLRLPAEVERWLGLEPQGSDGFMPPAMAAVAMGITEAELAAMIDRGWVSCRAVGSSIWVRPAAVSRMR